MKLHNKSGIYERISKEYAAVAKQNGKDMPVVTASTLVLLSTIPAGGTSNVKWGVLTSDNPILAQEVRLNINDEFIMTEIMVALYGVQGQASGPVTNISNRYWTYAPYQLSNKFLTIQPFWDTGILTLLVNGTQIIKNWDTNQHNFVPRTNDGGFVTPTNANQGNANWAEDGYVECTPTITLSGAKTNLLSLNFQGGNVVPVTNFAYIGDDATDTYFSINTAAFISRGFLAQNAAQFQGSQNKHPQHMQHNMHNVHPTKI